MLEFFRKLLLPFVPFYYVGALINKKLFDYQLRKSHSFAVPLITVGNLSVGGTGKSPMVAYLIELLQDKYKVATLSRGYKRKQKGFTEVNLSHTVLEVGDEPLQFKNNFPNITVAVDEIRKNGIEMLLQNQQPPAIVILDDAYQHRQVKAGLQIVLTSYNNLYVDDLMLPTGNLREPKSGAERANIIVVTKCPENLSEKKRNNIRKKLAPKPYQQLYFSYIKYSSYVCNSVQNLDIDAFLTEDFTLVTGIANASPLVAYLKARKAIFQHISFTDHHNFTSKELGRLTVFSKILTTEKDYMRLKHVAALKSKLFYLPIKCDIIEKKNAFENEILNYVEEKSN